MAATPPPTRFRSKLCRHASRAIPSNGFSGVAVTDGWFPPAAFTSTVGSPRAASTRARPSSSDARSDASIGTNNACPPAAWIASARSRPRSALRPATTTVAPAAANPSAIAPPSTPVAPITTDTSPLKSNSFIRDPPCPATAPG